MEYLDVENSVKHYLRNITDTGIRYEIAEPTGFDAANFVIKQDAKRYGRDVSFAPAELTFNKMTSFRGLTHRFSELIESRNTTGFESDWEYILKVEGVDYIIGQLDFKTAVTDGINYFTCSIIQQHSQAIIKRREDVKVDLFNPESLDDRFIGGLIPEKIFLQSTPEKQSSSWKMFEDFNYRSPTIVGNAPQYVYFNPFPFIADSGIENTISPIPQSDIRADEDFVLIEAENELTNVTFRIEGLKFKFRSVGLLSEFSSMRAKARYYIGEQWNDADAITIFDTGTIYYQGITSYVLDDVDFVFENLTIPRGQKLYLMFDSVNITQQPRLTTVINVTGGKVYVDAISRSISSIVNAVKLSDAMAQVIKSIANTSIDAPRFTSGEFKDQYITNGLLMRNIIDKPFTLSLKDILGYLPELNADYEVLDYNVFFGLYKDFYRNEKIGSFYQEPSEDFDTIFNDRYAVNTFNFKYTKYEKSNNTEKSREGVNTEMQMLLPNKMVDNSKDVTVGFIRDTFLIEKVRKDSIKIKEDTATEEDGDVFIIDCVNFNPETFPQKEQLTVYHKIENGKLKLLNDDSINWTLFGFKVGEQLSLALANSGFYIIDSITEDVLTLRDWVGQPVTGNTGYFTTRLTYFIDETNITNRTDEGFDVINGTTTPKGFSNLKFTPKRNTYNYWGAYLHTCASYRENGELKVTEFIHNGDLETKFEGGRLFKENAPIKVKDLPKPILTPDLVTRTVLCSMEQFWGVRNKLRTLRGYIEVLDTNGVMVKIHPTELSFSWVDNLLTINGEVRAENIITTFPKIGSLN